MSDAPTPETDAPDDETDAPDDETDSPSGPLTAPTSLAEYRYRVTRTSVSPENFRAFLGRADTREWLLAVVREKVRADDAEDALHDAVAEAIKAFATAPPSKEEVLIAWVATIVRRRVADYHKKQARRRKYEGPMPRSPDASSLDSAHDANPDDEGGERGERGERGDGGDGDDRDEDDADETSEARYVEPSFDPREGSVDDLELKRGFLFHWLERQVADHPMDRETFEIVLEHGLRKKTYQTLARERGMSLTVLSSRIFEFRSKYVPRYKRERNRAVLLLLLLGAAAVAVVVWLLSRRPETPRGQVHPAAAPIFEQVFGSDLVSHPAPDREPDAGDRPPDP